MALPRLNDTPKYELVIPSTQQTVKFRPFLVKEEKILMLAMESKDQHQAVNAIVDTIQACITEDINISQLAMFDVEYMFTQIRSKSVGETSTIGIKCSECETVNEVSIPLDDIKVDMPEVESTIKLTETVSIKMKWPSYKEVTSPAIVDSKSETKQTFDLIAACIDKIQTPEENINARDISKEELLEFIDSFTSTQFAMVRDYISNMPAMKHTVEFKCTKCEHENSATLRGMNDFF